MERITVDDVVPTSSGGDAERRSLSDPLNTSDVAINHYALEPGERLAGLHAHFDQEEVFVILDGTATFETLDREVPVEEGEAIRFAPGEYQSGKNDSDDEVVIVALGAPKGTEDWRVPLPCPECGYDNSKPTVIDGDHVLVCPDCEAEVETDCAECGNDNKFIKLDDGETPVDFCPDCGAETEV